MKIMHFEKVYCLRGDYQISAQIVPIIPANNAGVV